MRLDRVLNGAPTREEPNENPRGHERLLVQGMGGRVYPEKQPAKGMLAYYATHCPPSK